MYGACDDCGCANEECECTDEDARQVGMAFGVAAFNEAAGKGSLTGPGDCPTCLKPMVSGHHGCDCEGGPS